MTSRHVRGVVAGAVVVGLSFTLHAFGHDRDGALVIRDLIPIESHDVDPLVVEETYRAEVRLTARPGSRDFAGVAARIVHPMGLPFPLEPSDCRWRPRLRQRAVGQTVESVDTFTVRRHRRHPLKLQHLRRAISGRPDLILPEAWAGEWRLTITSKDPDSGSISSVDEVTESLGAGEPVGLSLLPDFVQCAWTGTDDALEAACRARFRFDGCLGDGSANVSVEREGDALTGRGHWEVTAAGACGARAGNGGESIEIAGVRADRHSFTPVASPTATTTYTAQICDVHIPGQRPTPMRSARDQGPTSSFRLRFRRP